MPSVETVRSTTLCNVLIYAWCKIRQNFKWHFRNITYCDEMGCGMSRSKSKTNLVTWSTPNFGAEIHEIHAIRFQNINQIQILIISRFEKSWEYDYIWLQLFGHKYLHTIWLPNHLFTSGLKLDLVMRYPTWHIGTHFGISRTPISAEGDLKQPKFGPKWLLHGFPGLRVQNI